MRFVIVESITLFIAEHRSYVSQLYIRPSIVINGKEENRVFPRFDTLQKHVHVGGQKTNGQTIQRGAERHVENDKWYWPIEYRFT